MARVHWGGFYAPPQVNPSGYEGTGRGIAPYAGVSGAATPQPIDVGAIVPVNKSTLLQPLPASAPIFSHIPTALGVGVSRIHEVGVLGVRF